MRTRIALVAGIVALAALAAACGGGGDETTTPPATTGGGTTTSPAASPTETGGGTEATLSIVDFSFSPPSVSVASGGTIEVTNNGQAPHTFTVDNTDVDESFDAGASQSVPIDLDPGDYPFHCKIHPNMTGTLTVG
jgi:plastocyanin